MVQNSFLQLAAVFGGNFTRGGLLYWADGLSGFFLLILATAVLLEFTQVAKKEEIIKKKTFVAVSVMGIFLMAEFMIGRNAIGRLDLVDGLSQVLAIVGCAFVVVGVVLNIVARLQLGSSWSNSIAIYKDQKLVDKGLYGIVRHPLYSTIFLMALGLAVQYGNYISLGTAFVIFLPLLYNRISQEEKVLKENLEGYTEYAKKVPALMPAFLTVGRIFCVGSFFAVHEISVNVWALRLCRATTVILLLVALYFMIPWLTILVFILMASSAFLSLSHSPLVVAYSSILNKLGATKEEIVDVNAIRFAQGLGSVLLLCAMSLIYVAGHPFGGWVFVSIVALSTAFGSVGYCLGAYIYFLIRKMHRCGRDIH